MNDDSWEPEEDEAEEEGYGLSAPQEVMLDAFSWYDKMGQTELVIRSHADDLEREWKTRLMPGPAIWLFSRDPKRDEPFELEWVYPFDENFQLRAWASGCPLDFGIQGDWGYNFPAEAA